MSLPSLSSYITVYWVEVGGSGTQTGILDPGSYGGYADTMAAIGPGDAIVFKNGDYGTLPASAVSLDIDFIGETKSDVKLFPNLDPVSSCDYGWYNMTWESSNSVAAVKPTVGSLTFNIDFCEVDFDLIKTGGGHTATFGDSAGAGTSGTYNFTMSACFVDFDNSAETGGAGINGWVSGFNNNSTMSAKGCAFRFQNAFHGGFGEQSVELDNCLVYCTVPGGRFMINGSGGANNVSIVSNNSLFYNLAGLADNITPQDFADADNANFTLLPNSSALASLSSSLDVEDYLGTIRYVEQGASGGGLSENDPMALSSALSASSDGDVIVCLDGTYTNTTLVWKTGVLVVAKNFGLVNFTGSGNTVNLNNTGSVLPIKFKGINVDWTNSASESRIYLHNQATIRWHFQNCKVKLTVAKGDPEGVLRGSPNPIFWDFRNSSMHLVHTGSTDTNISYAFGGRGNNGQFIGKDFTIYLEGQNGASVAAFTNTASASSVENCIISANKVSSLGTVPSTISGEFHTYNISGQDDDGDPLFANPLGGDFSLLPNSPALVVGKSGAQLVSENQTSITIEGITFNTIKWVDMNAGGANLGTFADPFNSSPTIEADAAAGGICYVLKDGIHSGLGTIAGGDNNWDVSAASGAIAMVAQNKHQAVIPNVARWTFPSNHDGFIKGIKFDGVQTLSSGSYAIYKPGSSGRFFLLDMLFEGTATNNPNLVNTSTGRNLVIKNSVFDGSQWAGSGRFFATGVNGIVNIQNTIFQYPNSIIAQINGAAFSVNSTMKDCLLRNISHNGINNVSYDNCFSENKTGGPSYSGLEEVTTILFADPNNGNFNLLPSSPALA